MKLIFFNRVYHIKLTELSLENCKSVSLKDTLFFYSNFSCEVC